MVCALYVDHRKGLFRMDLAKMIADLLNLSIPSAIGTGAAIGGPAAFVFIVAKWVAEFLGGRSDKREVRIENANDKAIKTLENLLDGVIARLKLAEDGLRECESKHSRSEGEVQRLQAIIQAQGEIRQSSAVIIAANNLKQYASKDASD